MAQTTAQVSMGCGKLEISSDNVTWTDISGVSQSLSGTEQTKMSGEVYTFDGNGPLIGGGKFEPLEIEVSIVYTETDAEGYELVREIFETAGCDVEFYLRWSPRGGNAGDEVITTGNSRLTSFTYPPLDASAGGPIMAGFKVKAGALNTTIKAS
jgi:hypothetical protein